MPSPAPTCGKYVDGPGAVSYPCSVESEHKGPCAANELPRSIDARNAWLRKQADAKGETDRASQTIARQASETLAQFQGPARTTAESLTEGATAAPGTCGACREGDHLLCTSMGEDFDQATGCTCYGRRPELHPQPPQDEPVHVTPVSRDFRRGQAGPGPCTDCINGNHRQCIVFINEGAVDADDFVDVSCSCFSMDPDRHERDRYPEMVVDSAPTRVRPGDQRLPESNDFEAIQDLVIQDIEERKRVGIQRYGTLLQPFNGRDMLQDAYDEAIDLAVYLRGLKAARALARDRLVSEVQKALRPVIEAGPDNDEDPMRYDYRLALTAVEALTDAAGPVSAEAQD